MINKIISCVIVCFIGLGSPLLAISGQVGGGGAAPSQDDLTKPTNKKTFQRKQYKPNVLKKPDPSALKNNHSNNTKNTTNNNNAPKGWKSQPEKTTQEKSSPVKTTQDKAATDKTNGQ